MNGEENWGCMKCGSTNDTENLFCEYCGSARPVDPMAIIKDKARGFLKQFNAQIGSIVKKKKCPACGSACNEDDVFCHACGTKLGGGTFTPMQEIVLLEKPAAQKITCRNCGHMNLDTLRFCNNCGEEIRKEKETICRQPLTPKSASPVCCPECGAKQIRGAAFCDECGARLLHENGYSQ